MVVDGLDAVGPTPLLDLDVVHPGLLAKAEHLQPGGSIKARVARHVLAEARNSGRLQPGQPVVEATSGNLGVGLALACRRLGHAFHAVVSQNTPRDRLVRLGALGAHVVRVDAVGPHPGPVTGADLKAAARQARHLARELDAYYADQYFNPACVIAHEQETGPEILAQLPGRLDGFVACVGSGGTFVGTARALRRARPGVHCAPVEPSVSRVLAGHAPTGSQHTLHGTGFGRVPPHWDPSLADSFLHVSDAAAADMRRELARACDLHVGASAAANVVAARELLASGRLGPGATVVTVLCDGG